MKESSELKKLMHRRLILVQINNEIFKAKIKNKNPKSVFDAATTHCKMCDLAWNQTDFQCLFVKTILYCLHAQPKFVFWSCRTRITSETPINKIPLVVNWRHIRRRNFYFRNFNFGRRSYVCLFSVAKFHLKFYL